MKVVLDTNMLVSGVYWRGPASRILELWAKDTIEVVVSPAMKRIRAMTHQAVLKRLLRQPGFPQGYARELAQLRRHRVNDRIR